MKAEPPRRRRRKMRPPPPTASWRVRYALGALAVTVAVGVVLGIVLDLLLPRGALRVGLGGLGLDATMLACLVPLYRRRHFRLRHLGLRPAPPARSVGLAVLALITIGIIDVVWLQDVLKQRHPSSIGVPLGGGPAAVAVAGLFLAVSAPVTEEIFFRGLLYRALRNRMGIARAALICGVLFGLVHGLAFPPDTLPPRMVFGIVACLLYEASGSLLPGIAVHCLVDASAFEASISHHNFVFAAFLVLGAVLLLYAGVRRLWRGRATAMDVHATVPAARAPGASGGLTS